MTLSNSRILIIEPDDVFRKALRLLFGKNVMCFGTVEASAETLTKKEYDAIVIDYWLAHINGAEFFKLTEAFQSDAKKIIVYDNDISNDIPKNYIIARKPFSTEKVEELIKMLENERIKAQTPIQRAENIVMNHVIGAMGAGLVPIPLVDMAALTVVQLNMLRNLADVFGVPFCRDKGKHLVATLVGSALPSLSAATIVSFLKAIPVMGQIFGALTLPISGGAATYALGRVFIQHFASGGTFLNFNPDKVKDYYAEMFKKGNLIVRHSF